MLAPRRAGDGSLRSASLVCMVAGEGFGASGGRHGCCSLIDPLNCQGSAWDSFTASGRARDLVRDSVKSTDC